MGASPSKGRSVVPQVNNPRPNWAGFVYLDGLQATTDRDGRFTLEGMPEGVKCDVVAEAWSAVRQRASRLGRVEERGDLARRRRDPRPGGRPARGIPSRTSGSRSACRRGPSRAIPSAATSPATGGTGLAFTRNDGEFTISGLTAGNLHRLTVIAEGFGARRGRSRRGPVARPPEAGRRSEDRARGRAHAAGPRDPGGGQASRRGPGDGDPERGPGRLPVGLQRQLVGRQRHGPRQRAGLGRVPLRGLRQGDRRREGQGLFTGEARLGGRGGTRGLRPPRINPRRHGARRGGQAGRRSEGHALVGIGRDDELSRSTRRTVVTWPTAWALALICCAIGTDVAPMLASETVDLEAGKTLTKEIRVKNAIGKK